MNEIEKNMIQSLKTAVFVIICLFVFSLGNNRTTDQYSNHQSEFSSEIQSVHNQAIMSATTIGTISQPISSLNPNPFQKNYKIANDTRLFNIRVITLRKSRETILPMVGFQHYLRVIPANPDDLPDLS